MPNVSNPDDDLMTAQQEKDLRHAKRSQPERARKREGETVAENVETVIHLGRRGSETEQALERARGKARAQAGAGRRGRSR